MFEMMLSTVGKKRIELPNSGLGSRYLIAGDEVGGYFGIVKGSESFTPAEVAAVGPLPGTINTVIGDDVWCKFNYRGTTILISRQALIGDTTFNSIYDVGLAYGTDGPGTPPTGSVAVDQNKIISRVGTDGKTYRYRVRLIRGLTVESTTSQGTAADSEYRLFENIIPTTNNPTPWGKTVSAVSGFGSNIWLREIYASSNQRWTAGGNNNYLYRSRSGTDVAGKCTWRPCLELIVE